MEQLIICTDKIFEKILNINTKKIQIISSTPGRIRDDIKKSKGLVIVQGGDEVINRLSVENKKVDILLSPEKNNKKDFIFFKNSGLNQVLCKLAKTNNIIIGFNFSDILNATSEERLKIMGRMIQNVKLCKKYRVKMIFSSFANTKYELRSEAILTSFSRILGI